MQNINDFISALNTLSEKNSFEVYIPSLKTNVPFKALTTGQQRLLYLCVTDNLLYRTKFVLATYQIIEENCLQKDYIKQFNILDRLIILLALRKNVLSSEITLEKNDMQYNTNFESSFEYAKDMVLPEKRTLEIKGIKINLQIPLIVDQYGIEKELRENIDNTSRVDDLLKESILNEACKFIDEITVEETAIGYKNLTYKDRVTLLEKLPAECLYEIQSFAESVTELQNRILSVTIDENNIIQFDLTVDFFLDR